MLDVHSALEGAINSVDRMFKFLGRISTSQVRNAEHRDFLKASALAWFKSFRPLLLDKVEPDLLGNADQAFDEILTSTEKAATKTTYTGLGRKAKAALLSMRSKALQAPKVDVTVDFAPHFGSLATDSQMQAILTRRWHECISCIKAGAPLAATVMMGGLLEALFVSRANKMPDKLPLFTCKSTPIANNSQKPLELGKWTLAPYIDVGHELKWISRSAKDIAVILRDYRNYIHPEKERSHGVVLSPDDALMFWEVTKSLVRELLLLKGA